MDTIEEYERFIKSLSPERKASFKERLIERVMALQTSQPWDDSRPGYEELEDKSFQELCNLLHAFVVQEELDRIPPWPPEQQQRYPRKLKGFRLFLTPKAYETLHGNPNEQDLAVYRRSVEIALGNNIDVRDMTPPYTGFGSSMEGSLLRFKAEWSKTIEDEDWEGFTLIFYGGLPGLRDCDPHLRFFHPDKPELIEQLFRRCLEISVS